jgi:hypothetical protein
MAAPNPERQRDARQTLERLLLAPQTVWVLHYACQSFAPGQAIRSPRVTAIVARNLASGHTETFSLNAEAELLKLNPVGVLSRLDQLERTMLDKFFGFLALNVRNNFLHWKMRSATYGFAAIEHRCAVLGGSPVQIPEQQRYDLAVLIEEIYGTDYVKAPHFERLAKLNNIPLSGFLPGAKEAEAFKRSEYFAIQRSISAKVGLLADIAKRAGNKTLKTNASWYTMNVGRVREAVEAYRDNPVQAIGATLVTLLTGAFAIWKLVAH